MTTTYDRTFFEYVNAGAVRSAEIVLPLLLKQLDLNSVLDVGCGQGAWLSVLERMEIRDLAGIDGDYVDHSSFLMSYANFTACNLGEDFDLQRKFDLVMCLEVAEHLPRERSSDFVENLTRHGSLILFSAAPPGQGGHDHVNEQPYDHWRELFRKQGYHAVDYLRPLIQKEILVEPWYRYNSLLYGTADRLAELPAMIRDCRIPDDEPVSDLSPIAYKLRKALVCLLPVKIMTRLAQCKESIVTARGKP